MKNIININSFKQRQFVGWIKIGFLTALLSILYFQTALATKTFDYAKIYEDPAVELMFKQDQLPSSYNYYYTGRSNLPYAVIAIDSNYSLDSKFWHRIESEDQVRKKISNLMAIGETSVTFGQIMASDNDKIGLWFSEYSHTVIRLEPKKTIKVFSPYQPSDRV